jgi:tetratricopeptide (TPR) repeat protein
MVVYDSELMTRVRRAIADVKREEYLAALVAFKDIQTDAEEGHFPTDGLSWYALVMALVERKYQPAVEMAKKAIELQFYRADHYVNLARIHVAAGDRKLAVEVVEKGLEIVPDDTALTQLREDLGIRQRPPLPFLDRKNPINRAVGRSRHATKSAEENERQEDDPDHE